MKNKIGIFIVIFLMGGFFLWVASDFYKAYAQPKKVVLQGEIDAQSYAISSKLPGRILDVYVKKGDMIKVGDVIFSISSPEVEAKLLQAKAAKDAAAAKKEQAYNGARHEQIRAAYEQYQKAKAAEELMQKTYERVEKLYSQGVVSEQKRDEVETKYKAAKHTTSAAKELYIMAKKGARKEVKKAAAAQERVYEAKVDEVDAYVKETKAYAYHDAEVSEVLLHSGELAPSGFPVVMSLDMNDVWARFAVREDYMKYFKKGTVLQLRIPALNKSYKFHVSYIAPMGDFATWRATESGKAFDMKSFEVELRPDEAIEGLRVGMSVLVEL